MQVHKKFKFHNLYSSPNIFRQIKSRQIMWAGHVSHMGERRKVYKVLVGNSEGKRPLGTPSRRWENGNRMYLREIGWRGGGCRVDPVGSGRGQWQFVSMVMNLQVLVPRR
jgi:hypothetical protein